MFSTLIFSASSGIWGSYCQIANWLLLYRTFLCLNKCYKYLISMCLSIVWYATRLVNVWWGQHEPRLTESQMFLIISGDQMPECRIPVSASMPVPTVFLYFTYRPLTSLVLSSNILGILKTLMIFGIDFFLYKIWLELQ